MLRAMSGLRGFLLLAVGLVVVVVLGLGGLYLYHRQRLDLPAIERAVAARVARAEAVRKTLGEPDQRAAFTALGPNPWSGEAIRLDERLAEARVVRASAAADSSLESARGPVLRENPIRDRGTRSRAIRTVMAGPCRSA
jgi:hypothetical protein